MCGILGAWSISGELLDMSAFREGLQKIAHRGPDGDGLYVWNARTGKCAVGTTAEVNDDASLALGHRRLAIIDLAGGAQPLSNQDENLWITFNGEIYNYIELADELKEFPFKTQSDTEVIVHAYEKWGMLCVEHFNGIFAFALWDQRKQQLFIARDHLGVKPVYYMMKNGVFLFSSEIKALLAYPGVQALPNWSSIAQYWHQGYVNGSDTFFEGIHKLPPAHTLTLDRSGLIRIERYWMLPPQVREDVTFDDAVAQLESLLSDAIRLQMRSDVEVGAHLSGGGDSSLVVSLAAQQSDKALHTFTGAWSSENNQFDERPYARLVSERWNTKHHETVIADEINGDYAETLRQMVWYMDEPAAGPGLIPQYWVSKLCSQHVKVVLGGQGGDELFGGYRAFLPSVLRTQVNNLFRRPLGSGVAELSHTLAAFAGWLKPADVTRALRRRMQSERVEWLQPQHQRRVITLNHPIHSSTLSPVDRMMRQTLTEYMVSLLHVEDRTSMAVSVESRVPLLDYRLVEMSVQLPYTMKIKGSTTKRLLRHIAQKHVPAPILARRDKVGFSTSDDFWFSASMQQAVKVALTDSAPLLLQSRAQERLHQTYQQHDYSYILYVWRLLNVDMWLKTFIYHGVIHA